MKISYEAGSPSDDGRANHIDALIDEAAEESFPASDPPAVHLEREPVALVMVAGAQLTRDGRRGKNGLYTGSEGDVD